MALILGLESSCDDTAAALVTSDRQILAQAVVGQNEAHRPFGGVVPEIAARAHVEILPGLIRRVLAEAGKSIADVDAIAATAGPGLIGGVMVALLAGKGLALGDGQAADRGQSSRRPCAEPASRRSGPRLSLSPAARVGRPLPAARSARGRRISPACDDHRRCRGRGVRQGRQAARPCLSGRAGDRGAGRRGGSQRRAFAPAAGRLGRAAFLLRRPQERGPARGRIRHLQARGHCRLIPAGGRRLPRRSNPPRASSEAMRRRWSSREASRPTARSGPRCNNSRRTRVASSACRPAGCARTMRR